MSEDCPFCDSDNTWRIRGVMHKCRDCGSYFEDEDVNPRSGKLQRTRLKRDRDE